MLVTESEQTQTSEKMGKTSSDYVKPIEDGVQPTQVNNFVVNSSIYSHDDCENKTQPHI